MINKGFWEGDIWNRVRSGEIRCHHLSISTVRDDRLEPQYYVGMLQAVLFMAQHDTLTGFANRSMLMEQLERHLSLAKSHGHAVALLYLDLDGFKPVNDRFGHNMGDRVLQLVAYRFRSVIREGDLQRLAAADNAMYAAKRAKTNPVQVCRGSQRYLKPAPDA